MTQGTPNASFLSRFIAFLLPLLLAAYWPLVGAGHSVHTAVIAIRLGVIAGAAILALLWLGRGITPTEVRWAVILGIWLVAMLFPVVLGGSISRGLHNWLRVLPVYACAVLLARPLRNPGTRQALGMGLSIAGVVSFAFILWTFLHYAGLTIPTYERVRMLKGVVQRMSGVALNPLASATLMFCVLSLCLVKSGWWYRGLVLAIGVLSSVLTGSRAPLALIVAAGVALGIANLFHRRTPAVRAIAGIAVCCSLVAAATIGSFVMTPENLSAATEGRYDLWIAGVDKFLDRPLTGYGPDSWHDDLSSRLPSYYAGTTGLTELRAGGYHSEFVTLLAEGGIVCFVPAMIIFGLLYRACSQIAFHRSGSGFRGQAFMLAFFLLFFRAAVEVPGMFGYGEDVNDYLAVIFLAIVISGVSLLSGRQAQAAKVRSSSRDARALAGCAA